MASASPAVFKSLQPDLPSDLLAALQKLYDHLDKRPMTIKRHHDRANYTDFSITTPSIFYAVYGKPMPSWNAANPADTNMRDYATRLLKSALEGRPAMDRAVGAFVGNAIADALGHPLEFLPVNGSLKPYSEERSWLDDTQLTADGSPLYHNELNRFRLKPGQHTDDFSMAACLADTLLCHRGYHGGDARARWYHWWNAGYNNDFRFDVTRQADSCGLGGNISESIYDVEACGRQPISAIPAVYSSSGEDAGNGSIMRLSPIPIFYHRDIKLAEEMAIQQSLGTHPGKDAASACAFMTHFMVYAIQHGLPPVESCKPEMTPIQEFITKMIGSFCETHSMESHPSLVRLARLLAANEPADSTEVCWNWKSEVLPVKEVLKNRKKHGSYNGYPVSAGYFGSYCYDGLAMALWALWHSTSFEDCLFKIVNLLGDADSTGAIACQMAGSLYGYSGILRGKPLPPTSGASKSFGTFGECWLHHLSRWDPFQEIPLRAVLLFLVAPLPPAEVEANVRKIKITDQLN